MRTYVARVLVLTGFVAVWGCAMTNETPAEAQDLTAQQAIAIARATIHREMPDHEFVVLENKTMERSFGWVFFYTTKEFLETGDPGTLVAGNGPLVVERKGGATHFLPTSLAPELAVQQYEKGVRAKPAKPKKN